MSEHDIVAELDAWLAGDGRGPTTHEAIQRARDEIDALCKAQVHCALEIQMLRDTHATTRAEALEEAAAVVDKQGYAWIAEDVLALKDKPS